MAIHEIEKFDKIILTTADATDASVSANAGMIKLSGSKLWFDNGTTWEIVTSA